MVVDTETPAGRRSYIGSPDQALRHAARVAARRCPCFGQHTDAVLRGLGYAAGDIAALREQGVIG